MVFREGRTKAVGNVLRPEPMSLKPARHDRRNPQHNNHTTDESDSQHVQESDVTAMDSPFEIQADKRVQGGGAGGGRRGRKRHDKPPEPTQPTVAAAN